MQTQITLDGRKSYDADDFEIEKVRRNIEKLNDFAKKNLIGFGSYCERSEIIYPGKPSEINTLFCISGLEKEFGFSTSGMVSALMTYSALNNYFFNPLKKSQLKELTGQSD